MTGTEVPGQKDREGQRQTNRNKDKNKETGIRDKNMVRVRTGSIGQGKEQGYRKQGYTGTKTDIGTWTEGQR